MHISEEEYGEVDPTVFGRMLVSLRYLCHNRFDISYASGLVSRYMNKPLRPPLLVSKVLFTMGLCSLSKRLKKVLN